MSQQASEPITNTPASMRKRIMPITTVRKNNDRSRLMFSIIFHAFNLVKVLHIFPSRFLNRGLSYAQ
ncbi:hypothetical protein [Candidatus Pantoea multigeneris]|uniref:Uncharacterized protein n=1 Tax=Candidatus Pantoea multigeneris TaxID=2608357 RepID=A0ABX0R7C5_9GAMM|nr:hypothetical protein [Pantoea multigeneris]NIF21275.1 hypothetical protein [Pantoea multigeneris]